MSVQTKKELAEKLSVPYNYIKAKKPEELLNIYKRCKSGPLPYPPMRKFIFNGKIYLIPKTKLNRVLYGKVFLTPSPIKEDVIAAASKLKIKMPQKITKDNLLTAIKTKFISMGITEPIHFHTMKQLMKNKKKVKMVNRITSPIVIKQPRKRLLVESIIRQKNNSKIPQIPSNIKITKDTTVRYISNKKSERNGGTRPRNNAPAPRARNNAPAPRPRNNTPAPRARNNTPAPRARNNAPAPRPRNNAPTPRARNNTPAPRAPEPVRTPLPPRVTPQPDQVPIVPEPVRPPLPPRVPRPNQSPAIPEPVSPAVPPLPEQQGRKEPVAPVPSVKRNIKISNLMKRINHKRNIKISNLMKRINHKRNIKINNLKKRIDE